MRLLAREQLPRLGFPWCAYAVPSLTSGGVGRVARFERLRWVPMLIRAYYDAQAQVTSTRLAAQPKLISANVSITSQPKPRRARPTGNRARGKMRAMSASRNQGNQGPQGNQSEPAIRLLRELRTTNRKLRGLDEIQQKLMEISATLDDFHRKVDDLSAKETSQTPPTPVRHPMQTPMM